MSPRCGPEGRDVMVGDCVLVTSTSAPVVADNRPRPGDPLDPDAAISVRGLVKRYGDRAAVDGLDLDIRRGEIFALLGPNGAGKTTTVEVLEGYRKRDGGDVRVLGVDPARGGRRWKGQLGIVLQSGAGDSQLSVRELLTARASYYGEPRDPDEVLELVGLTDKAGARGRTLSGGQRRRLDVALGIVGRPRLLFLDEPTTGFDPEARRQFWALIRSLRDLGTTMLLTTHYLDEAEALADRVGVISKGRLLVVEETAALLSRLGERRLAVKFARRLEGPLPDLAAAKGELSADGLSFSYVERPEQPRAAEVLGSLYTAGLPVAEVNIERPRLEDVVLRVLSDSRGAKG